MLTNCLLLCFCCLALIFSVMIISSKNPIHSILYLILVFCNITFVLIILGVEFIAITFLIVYVGAIAVLFLFVVMMLNIKILELDEVFWKYIPVGLLISSCFLFQLFFYVFNFNIFDIVDLFFYNKLYYFKEVGVVQNTSNSSLNMLCLLSGSDPIMCDSFSGNFIDYLQAYSDVCLGLDFTSFSAYTPIKQAPYSVFCMISSESLLTQNFLDFSNELTNTELLGWLIYTYTFFIFLVISLILLISMIGSIILVLNQNINIKRQLIFRQTLRDLKSSVSLKS